MGIRSKIFGCLAGVAILATSFLPFFGATEVHATSIEPQYTQGNEILGILFSNPPVGENNRQYLIGDEVLEKRTEYSKAYWLGGSTFANKISLAPIHYKDNYQNASELWKDIDTTIVAGGVSKAPYILTIDYANYQVTMTSKKDGSVTSLILGKVGGLSLASKVPAVIGNTATFANVSTDVDIKIVAGSKGVSIQRIIKSPLASANATFTITQVGTGIKMVVGGTSANHTENFVVKSNLVGSTLTEWVEADVLSKATYPLTIDPTLYVQPSTIDTWLRESSPNTNYGTNAYLDVNAYIAGWRWRSILQFELGSIPAGATITSANMSMYYYAGGGGGSDPVGRTYWVYALTRHDWTETDATWNNYKAASAWSTAGGDYTTTNGTSQTIPAAYGWVDWASMANMVQGAINASFDLDIIVRDNNEVDALNKYTEWYSSEEAVQTTKRPALYVVYTLPQPTVTTQAATSVEETSFTGNGNVTAINDTNITQRGFVWDTATHGDPGDVPPSSSAYSSNWTETGSWGIGTFGSGANIVGLTNGVTYYVRATAKNNTNNWGYGGEVTLHTKPEAPTNLVATGYNQQVNLTWTKGTGSENTTIRGSIGAYPATYNDGTLVYNGTASSANHTGLTNGDHWYYRAWARSIDGALNQWSDAYVQADATPLTTPTLTTTAATNVEETTATGNGNITNTGGENATSRGFEWDIDSGAPYSNNVTENGNFGTGAYALGLTGLPEGTKIYYRAMAYNSKGWGYAVETSFLTKPLAPTAFTAVGGDTVVFLNWTKGVGSENTTIRGKIGSYPADQTSDTLVYNGTAATANHTGLTNGDHWYYRAWAQAVDGVLTQWSDAYAQADATPNVVTVTSFMVEGTGRNWAIVRGYIQDEGGGDVTTTIVQWGTTSGAYTANTTFDGVWNTGDYFVLTARSLQPATVYYWRVGGKNTGGSYAYGAERTWATEGSPSLREYLNTGQDADSTNITGTTWYSQQFTTSALGHTASSVRVYIKRYGTPGTITLSLRHATAGLPTGLDLASATYAGNSLLTSYMMVEFNIDDVSLEGSTQYAIVLRALAGDSSNGIYWGIDNGGGLANAVSSNSTNGGLSWNSETPKDALFEIWGEEVVEVKGGGVFSGFLETNDMLFTVDMYNIYPPYYPTDDSGAYFDLRLYDTDGTTVLASTPVVDWGRRAGSIYLSADAATPLTWGSAFYLKVVGSFDPTNIIASYQLTTADWWGSDLTYLDRWAIREARIMEIIYNLIFVTTGGGVEVLNDAGGVEMDKGINGLSFVRPNLFQTVVHIPTYTAPTWTGAFEGATTWQTEVGTTITNTMTSIGTLVNVSGKVVLQVIFMIAMFALALFTRSFLFGLVLAVPIALWGASLRVIPIQIVGLIGAFAALIFVYKQWWSKG